MNRPMSHAREKMNDISLIIIFINVYKYRHIDPVELFSVYSVQELRSTGRALVEQVWLRLKDRRRYRMFTIWGKKKQFISILLFKLPISTFSRKTMYTLGINFCVHKFSQVLIFAGTNCRESPLQISRVLGYILRSDVSLSLKSV